MEQINITLLIGFLILLLGLSAFFSASETGMMSLNRYRLRHLARKKNRSAIRVNQLLSRTDRLLGAILIGNTFANVMASSIVTMIAAKYLTEAQIILVSFLLSLVVLIFSEILPKTLAALHPQKTAFWASAPLKFTLTILSPLVFMTSTIVRALLWVFGVKIHDKHTDALSTEELRTVVNEATGKITPAYQDMLLRILDLEKVTVEDVMIPRNEITGLDLSDPWEEVLQQLTTTSYTRLPVYFENLDQVQGFLHTKKALNLISKEKLSKEDLLSITDKVYFIPESTPINIQLAHFQQQKHRIGLVVDEYGDIQGLATLEDILEEIVGEFTTGMANLTTQIQDNQDGSFTIDGSVNIRELNRTLDWRLPVDSAKTLSGLIVENIQALPIVGISLRIGFYRIEIIAVKDNMVKEAVIWPEMEDITSESF